ncbi:DUF4192 domain-containing protein [Marisediminicola senii]|uniref:DUF4192 domain-containing protein n=1 Tax=Marisediminicola senii TaxID=2711233 RepID=UPI0013EBB362|nr:DUF4192 domain-containing protein [Marisediminicola senii]
MNHVVTTRSPHDFLSVVPYLAGYLPENSVVLVAFEGRRTRGVMRFGLPADTAIGTGERHATSVLGMFCRIPKVDAVVAIAYTDTRIDDRLPLGPFMRAVIARARFSGFTVLDALCVAADGWGSYLDPECPPGGRPLALITGSPAGRQMAGEAPVAPRPIEHGATLPPVDPMLKEAFDERLDTLRDALDDVMGSDDDGTMDYGQEASDLVETLVDFASTVEKLLASPIPPAPELAATAVFGLRLFPLRDSTLLQVAFGVAMGRRLSPVNLTHDPRHRAAADQTVAERAAAERVEAERATASRLLAGIGPRPDGERMRRSIDAWRVLAALADDLDRPPLLCMLGWMEWALGRSSVAAVYVDEALRIDPECTVAGLLAEAFAVGHLPEWAFAPDASTPDAFTPDG